MLLSTSPYGNQILSDANCAYSVAAVEKAEAQKIQVVKAAEADAEAKFLQGQGIARQRQAIVNGLRESVLNFSNDVNGALLDPAVFRTVSL